jgi:hypothetical protein
MIHREITEKLNRVKLAQDHVHRRTPVKLVLDFRVPVNHCGIIEVLVLEDDDKTSRNDIIDSIKIKLNSRISFQNLSCFITKQLKIYLGPI